MTYEEKAKMDILKAQGLGWYTGLFYRFSEDGLLADLEKRRWEKIRQKAYAIKRKYPGSQFRIFNFKSGYREIYGNKIFSEACDKEDVSAKCWNLNVWGRWTAKV